MITAAIAAVILLAAPPDIAVTRWVSPDSSLPTGFAEWRAGRTDSPWSIRCSRPRAAFGTPVDIFVAAPLHDSLGPELDTLVADLAAESSAAAVFAVTGAAPESLRAFLQAEHALGVRQAVLVGDVPVAWYQMFDDWNSNGLREPDEGYEEFPCDLFYMDIDGRWLDEFVYSDTLDSLLPGSDGIYDFHGGHFRPELAVSRIPASVMGNEVALLRAYFDRNHRYRTGRLPLADRALVYIDDDWSEAANDWSWDVGYLYPDRTLVADRETTRCVDYRARIDTLPYQWVSLCSHSWPAGHAMKYNGGSEWDWFYAEEIPGLNPPASFYNLFACSNARFTEPGFCGGAYTLLTDRGLGAVGSTKTGSMLEFAWYYYPLGTGRNLGEALAEWLDWQMQDVWENWERSWYQGMTHIGDGTLRPRAPQQTSIAERPAPPLSHLALTAFPNPARTRVRLGATAPLGPGARISIFDAAGRLALARPVGSSADRLSCELDVSGLPAGLYLIRLTEGRATATGRIIIQR